MTERASIRVLQEAIELQRKKGEDYNNKKSRVNQADYYEHGAWTLLDIIKAKYLRIVSVLETMELGGKANFESIEDSCLDLINYTSFLSAYLQGEIEGQQSNRDIFNREVSGTINTMLIPPRFQFRETDDWVYDPKYLPKVE